MCYITNNQSDDQTHQRNFARFFAPTQNYQNQFAVPLNAKSQNTAEYQDESDNFQYGQQQYQFEYPNPFLQQQLQQQPQSQFVYIDSKPAQYYNGYSAPVQNNENDVFNILGPIQENDELQIQQDSNVAYDELPLNQGFEHDNFSPFFAKNEEESIFFQPQFEDNNLFNYDNIMYNNNANVMNNNNMINNISNNNNNLSNPIINGNNYIAQQLEQNLDLQYYAQQSIGNNQLSAPQFELCNEYQSQNQMQMMSQYQPQEECHEQLNEQIPNMNYQQGNFQSNMQGAMIKQECKNDIISSSDLCDEDNNNNVKYEDRNDEEFTGEGQEKQNEIIDKIRKSNKKNVVKNIMSAFKRFIQDIQSDCNTQSPSSPSQSLSSSHSIQVTNNLNSISSISTSNTNSNSNSSSPSLCSSQSSSTLCSSTKVSKISNLKQNLTSSSDSYQIDVALERENVLAIYNQSKVKPDSIEEMGKKFKRYISSKQFNHYTIRLLVQHQNYGEIFKYFLETHAQNWLNNSKVDDPYGHKIMIEFLSAAYEDINIIEKLKKHEKRKAIYQ